MAETRKRPDRGWFDGYKNRRDARRAGVITSVVASEVLNASATGNTKRNYEACIGETALARDGTGPDTQAAYQCELERYNAQERGRRAARRTAVVAGVAAHAIMRD